MVITRWEDIKTLQIVITTMAKRIGQVTRRKSRDSTTVKQTKEIIKYQKHMGGVDREDQQRLMGTGFPNVTHFKNQREKDFWYLLTLVPHRDSWHGTWRRSAHRYQE